MNALLRAEARRMLTTRSVLVLAAIVVVYPALGVLGANLAGAEPPVDGGGLLQVLRGGADVLILAAVLLGVLAAAGEYRHSTIVPSLLASPRRERWLAAKLGSQAALGVTLAVAMTAVGLVAGALYLAGNDVAVDVLSGDVLVMVGAVLLVATLYATMGAAVGALVKNQTAAVAGTLIWYLAVENVIPVVLGRPGLERWLPGGAADRLLQAADPPAGMGSPWTALAVLVALTVALAVAAVIATRRADVH